MLLGDPPRTEFDLNFWLFGIPVRVHPWFWLITLLLGSNNLTNAATVVTWILAVFLSILIHEFGHALVMRAYGYRPWITLYGMGGVTSCDPGYYRTSGPGTFGQILISAAGPGAGFLLAAMIVLGLVVAGYLRVVGWSLESVTPLNPRIANLLSDILFISVVWGMVNLLPVYPLDGGQIAREILLRISPRNGIQLSLSLSIVAAGMMAGVGLLLWGNFFVALLFGYLAYGSYVTLQAYSGRGGWQ